jgi:hypothetical protein
MTEGRILSGSGVLIWHETQQVVLELFARRRLVDIPRKQASHLIRRRGSTHSAIDQGIGKGADFFRKAPFRKFYEVGIDSPGTWRGTGTRLSSSCSELQVMKTIDRRSGRYRSHAEWQLRMLGDKRRKFGGRQKTTGCGNPAQSALRGANGRAYVTDSRRRLGAEHDTKMNHAAQTEWQHRSIECSGSLGHRIQRCSWFLIGSERERQIWTPRILRHESEATHFGEKLIKAFQHRSAKRCGAGDVAGDDRGRDRSTDL